MLWERSRLLGALGLLHDSALSPRHNVNMDTGTGLGQPHRYWAKLGLPQALLGVCVCSLEVEAGHGTPRRSQGTARGCLSTHSAGRRGLFLGRKLGICSCLSPTRLTPIYFSAGVLWILIAVSALGILHFFLSHYVGLNVLQFLTA